MSQYPRDPLPPEEVTANLASLGEMTPDVLPDGPARIALVWLISSGANVYCYWSGGRTYGRAVVWLQPLADVRPGKDGRVAISEWRDYWRELLCEMGISESVVAESATMQQMAESAKAADRQVSA